MAIYLLLTCNVLLIFLLLAIVGVIHRTHQEERQLLLLIAAEIRNLVNVQLNHDSNEPSTRPRS